jgi:hypothetical protein
MVLDRNEWSASAPAALPPGELLPATHCIGGCVGSEAGLNTMEKKKSLAPAGNWTLIHQSLVAMKTILHQYIQSMEGDVVEQSE